MYTCTYIGWRHGAVHTSFTRTATSLSLRIRVPLGPWILKLSRSCTTLDLPVYLSSPSATWRAMKNRELGIRMCTGHASRETLDCTPAGHQLVWRSHPHFLSTVRMYVPQCYDIVASTLCNIKWMEDDLGYVRLGISKGPTHAHKHNLPCDQNHCACGSYDMKGISASLLTGRHRWDKEWLVCSNSFQSNQICQAPNWSFTNYVRTTAASASPHVGRLRHVCTQESLSSAWQLSAQCTQYRCTSPTYLGLPAQTGQRRVVGVG